MSMYEPSEMVLKIYLFASAGLSISSMHFLLSKSNRSSNPIRIRLATETKLGRSSVPTLIPLIATIMSPGSKP